MESKGNIAIKRKNGTIESIYCYSNNTLEENGVILYHLYKSPEKINNLINLGDLFYLGQCINPDPLIKHDYENRQENVVIACKRDNNEVNTEKKIFSNLMEVYNKNLRDESEIIFMYDEKENKWFFSNNFINYFSLEDKLKELNLIEETEPVLDDLLKQDIEFTKLFNTDIYYDVYESYEDAYHDVKKVLSSEKGVKAHISVIKNFQLEFEDEGLSESELKILWDKSNKLIRTLKKYYKEKYEKVNSAEEKDLENSDI